LAQVNKRPVVHYVDLPVYGTPMSLAWKKHRMRCVNVRCPTKSWVLSDHRIAAKHCLLTTRAAKWATVQVGGGRTVSEVAAELACDWHTVNDAVTTYGTALLAADRKRLNQTSVIGLDETSFVRLGPKKHTGFATTVADVEHHQIIDILPTRKYTDVAGWIDAQPAAWKERIRFGALDMSLTYAAVYPVVLPKAAQVVDPFHAIALANRALDAVRRRVQTEQTGHRGRKDDPLYRARRALLMGEERNRLVTSPNPPAPTSTSRVQGVWQSGGSWVQVPSPPLHRLHSKVPGQIVFVLGLFSSPTANVSNNVSNSGNLLRTRTVAHGRPTNEP
jgi:transposase